MFWLDICCVAGCSACSDVFGAVLNGVRWDVCVIAWCSARSGVVAAVLDARFLANAYEVAGCLVRSGVFDAVLDTQSAMGCLPHC